MKRLVMTMALTCVLSISALGGDLPTSDSPVPVPSGTPQGISAQIPSVSGELSTSEGAQQISDAAFSVLLTVLGFV